MRTTIKHSLVITALCMTFSGAVGAVVVVGFPHMTDSGGTYGGGDWGAGGSWAGYGTGEAFWRNDGSNWDDGAAAPVTLPIVEVTGSRWNMEDASIRREVIITGQTNKWYAGPFDSRDDGKLFLDRQAAPPDNKVRDACLKNCADIKASEDALCDSRTATLGSLGVPFIAAGVWVTMRYAKVSLRMGETIITPKSSVAYGAAAVAAYSAICKGRSSQRFFDCTTETCKL